ncbi:MAG: hypothetical protein AAF601_13955 [Pseudomonadota bacterium]
MIYDIKDDARLHVSPEGREPNHWDCARILNSAGVPGALRDADHALLGAALTSPTHSAQHPNTNDAVHPARAA